MTLIYGKLLYNGDAVKQVSTIDARKDGFLHVHTVRLF